MVWPGYKVGYTETCDGDLPHLVTDVRTTPATTVDVVAGEAARTGLAERGRSPGRQYADSAYVTPETIRAAAAFGTLLIGPVLLDSSWQAKAGKGFDRSRFVVDWDTHSAICPMGKYTTTWRDQKQEQGIGAAIRFDPADCAACPSRTDCTRDLGGRQITLPPRDLYEIQQANRADQADPDWQRIYNRRAAIEATLSEAIRAYGLRHTRHRGQARRIFDCYSDVRQWAQALLWTYTETPMMGGPRQVRRRLREANMGSSDVRWLRHRSPATGMILMATVMAAALSGAPAVAYPGSPADSPGTGLGTTETVNVAPPTQIDTATDWSHLSIGVPSTCGIRTGGTLWCWDLGGNTPRRVGADTRWSTVASGWGGTCGIDVNGSLWCWDSNSAGWDGQGDVPPGDPRIPARVGEPGGWATVAVGGLHTCGVRTNGTLWCWGFRTYGQVGNGNNPPPCGIPIPTACVNIAQNPVQVGDGTHWTTVTAGHDHTCAGRADGTVWCWGSNDWGQMGNGIHECYSRPWPVGRVCPPGSGPQLDPGQVGTARNWTRVMAGDYFNCGLRTTGALWCWGDNQYRQLGVPTEEQQRAGGAQLTPLPVEAGSSWVDVATGDNHICAIRTDRTLWCWGMNEQGQLGTGRAGEPSPPVQVSPGARWKRVVAHYAHSCAIRTDGTLWCWGDADRSPRPAPRV